MLACPRIGLELQLVTMLPKWEGIEDHIEPLLLLKGHIMSRREQNSSSQCEKWHDSSREHTYLFPPQSN